MTTSFRSVSGRIGLLAGLLLPFPVLAQTGQVTAVAASQLDLETSDAGSALATAMSTLANDPRNIDALIAAGESALKLDDPRAALGFFGRADDVSPSNGRAKAGLGRAMLALGQVGDGLRLMEQAVSLGYSDAGLLADRGLARDLTGNQGGAQQDYQAALRLDPKNDLLMRRYAVSLGISGQVEQAEKTIEPLLYKNDRAAWRDRAFILAMNGRTPEALTITDRVMPRALADAIKPYMERMAMLTPGQRAAAVHLGQFPEGLVNVRVASTAIPAKPPAAVAATTPADGKKDRKDRKKDRKQGKSDASGQNGKIPGEVALAAAPPMPPPSAAPLAPSAATPERTPPAVPPAQNPASAGPRASSSYQPGRVAAAPSSPSAPAAVSTRVTASTSAPAPAQAPAPRIVQGPPASTSAAVTRAPAAAAPAQGPARQPAQSMPAATPTAPATRVAAAPAASPAVAPPPSSPGAALPAPVPSAASPVATPGESTRSLADIMADIEVPASERRHDVVPVNLAEIAAIKAAERKAREAADAKAKKEDAKRKAEAEAKAKADAEKKRLAANPARYWVQIGAGRDTGAMAFTLKRMKKDHAALASQDGWWADYGRTKRLVVGPFRNLDRAKAVEADMKKAGSDAFVWRSEAGEEVTRLGGD